MDCGFRVLLDVLEDVIAGWDLFDGFASLRGAETLGSLGVGGEATSVILDRPRDAWSVSGAILHWLHEERASCQVAGSRDVGVVVLLLLLLLLPGLGVLAMVLGRDEISQAQEHQYPR
jgi:hypothetical protein